MNANKKPIKPKSKVTAKRFPKAKIDNEKAYKKSYEKAVANYVNDELEIDNEEAGKCGILPNIIYNLFFELNQLRNIRHSLENSLYKLNNVEKDDSKEMSYENNESISYIHDLERILSILKIEKEEISKILTELNDVIG